MGKKVNRRATQAQNQLAISKRRRAEEARRKAWWDAHLKHVIIGIAAAVAVVLLVVLGWNLYTDSLLPVEIKNLSAVEDNWLVIDTDNTTRTRYHHPASFTMPEGFTKSEFSTYNDGIQRDFYCIADSEDSLVENIYIAAASELNAETYIQRVIDNAPLSLSDENTQVQNAEPLKGVVAGKEATYIYLTYSTGEGENATAYSCVFVAFDAPRNVVVHAVVSSRSGAPEAVPSVDALLAEAETLLAGLTIVE